MTAPINKPGSAARADGGLTQRQGAAGNARTVGEAIGGASDVVTAPIMTHEQPATVQDSKVRARVVDHPEVTPRVAGDGKVAVRAAENGEITGRWPRSDSQEFSDKYARARNRPMPNADRSHNVVVREPGLSGNIGVGATVQRLIV